MPRKKKRCDICRLYKPIEEFPLNHRKTRLARSCDPCQTLKHQRRRLRQKAGTLISTEELKELYKAQQNKCAICLQEVTLCIDHDHTTLKVRGLLCHNCNIAIGLFKDSRANLKRAEIYLREHQCIRS